MTAIPIIQSDYPLRDHNTFGINAIAKRYVTITSAKMLLEVNVSSELAGLPRLVLGGGSNILLTGDFPGVVFHMCMKGIDIVGDDAEMTYVRAAAGENWHQLVRWTLARGLGGLENLSLIPGSVGAAPIQNIGAYGAELKDCFHSVTVLDLESGAVSTLDKTTCAFGYRDSIFKQALRERSVILDVSFALPKQWQPNLRYAELSQEVTARGLSDPSAVEISDAVMAIRTRKLPDPAVIGNAGSFFKNPVVPAQQRHALLERYPQLVSYPQADGSYKLAAGWLIDQCGWKGGSLGAAGVYEKQALVLVNRGGASGQDILTLARKIQDDALARFGVRIEPEPVFV
ncbi:UDP-N-acetylmuramate dehydrogenase [Noviherbaspirillum sedimenti]|uniref:UDP-N-acetylenolpyruvoylglucosamine reductase n=1 Tax=Noviherbaspirillum sedimenti TaxID=2320865 RepID=A0A3A3G4Q5_9BURK|nr:UDP-N-acetylmuramate dehydrogenase [Noviherbaspirillum sedimenti]RJG01759.1 UDP-N-acetylmuramate dehydrogenase [Noviherbaspirillum sedimenti]